MTSTVELSLSGCRRQPCGGDALVDLPAGRTPRPPARTGGVLTAENWFEQALAYATGKLHGAAAVLSPGDPA
jgi:hypothetical protein